MGKKSTKHLDGDLRRFTALALEMGALEAKEIDPKTVVVRNWIRLKCQYGCGNYGKSLTCPPYSPTPEQTRQVLKEYSHAILMRLPDESTKTHDMIAKLERHVFLEGYHSAFGIVAGPMQTMRKMQPPILRRSKIG